MQVQLRVAGWPRSGRHSRRISRPGRIS